MKRFIVTLTLAAFAFAPALQAGEGCSQAKAACSSQAKACPMQAKAEGAKKACCEKASVAKKAQSPKGADLAKK